jgi:hypothetical protein
MRPVLFWEIRKSSLDANKKARTYARALKTLFEAVLEDVVKIHDVLQGIVHGVEAIGKGA